MKTPRSFPVTIREGFAQVKVYRQTRKDGTPIFSVDWRVDGKRQRQAFADWERAKVEAEAIVKKLATGDAAALQLNGLDRATYLRARELLQPAGVALDTAAAHFAEAVTILGGDHVLEAVKEYARRHPRSMPQKTVREVVDELVAAKGKANRSAKHVKDLQSRCGAFAQVFVNVQIQAITSADMRRYLDGKQIAPRTFRNHVNALTNFFEFAKSRGYVPKDFDGLDGIELPDDREGEIEIFSPAELSLMLEHARPELVPFIVLGAFAGIRTAELQRLDWADIRPDFIEIKAAKAKTASRRLIPICATLSAWLEPFRQPAGAVVPFANIAKQIGWLVDSINAALKAQAKEDGKPFTPFEWKRNGLRHGFCSYRLAQVQDVGKVSLEAGNSPQMLFRHYRELVTPAEAAAWFSIAPKRTDNVIVLPWAATA